MRCVIRSTASCCAATPSLTSRTYSVSTSATVPAGQLKAGTRLGADSCGSAVRSRAATSFFTGVDRLSELHAMDATQQGEGGRGKGEEVVEAKGRRNKGLGQFLMTSTFLSRPAPPSFPSHPSPC